MHITKEQMIAAFTEWDKRYREHPEDFEDFITNLLKGNPESYGEAAAPYFISLVKELKAAKKENEEK